jgi:predicted nucleic acid-binding protein
MTVEDGSRLYLDSNCLIYYAEAHPQFGTAMQQLVSRAMAGHYRLYSSELTLAEVLTIPLRSGRNDLVAIYQSALQPGGLIEVIPVSRGVLIESAQVRLQYALKLPDAIHVSSALIAECFAFVTEDDRMQLPPIISKLSIDTAATFSRK